MNLSELQFALDHFVKHNKWNIESFIEYTKSKGIFIIRVLK
jgi:hypothetical protein